MRTRGIVTATATLRNSQGILVVSEPVDISIGHAFPFLSPESVSSQLILSIAMEELALSGIFNAEGEKIEYAVGASSGINGQNPTIGQLLRIDESVRNTLQASMGMQFVQYHKLSAALKAP